MKYLGDKTPWGKVCAIGMVSGERYYWLIDKNKTVSMMPACTVEKSIVMDAKRANVQNNEPKS